VNDPKRVEFCHELTASSYHIEETTRHEERRAYGVVTSIQGIGQMKIAAQCAQF
jgi:hypothetical protein